MTRSLSAQHMEVRPLRTFDTLPEEYNDGWGTLAEARNCFFQVGDLIACETSYGPRKALVVQVSREFNERLGEWIPRYRVRLYGANGKIGYAWRWAFPGYIRRAYQSLAEIEEKSTDD
jgi:hypothetical protein